MRVFPQALTLFAVLAPQLYAASPAVVFSEVMYHPVELPSFAADGSPLLDVSSDVHEFIELANPGTNSVNLTSWRLSGGIDLVFPIGATIPPGGFLVIAKDPARLAAVPQYGLNVGNLLGPYSGQLGNGGDIIRLHNESGAVVDALSYSSSTPWSVGANALGAKDEFTGLNSSNHQYRGRSLERVSYTWPANDPANWLGSPLAAGPSPGKTNSVQMPTPRPIALSITARQQSDQQTVIRANQAVQIECVLSGTNSISNTFIEYFVDNVDLANESRFTAAASGVGAPVDARYVAVLPGQADRSVVRFRFRGNRGAGVETVSPRADDPFQWHAYFVTPVRGSSKPIYDLFISQADLNTMATNITQSPRRVSLPDPPGYPRASWNATVPGIFVHNGVVWDIRVRHHGSRYSRNPGRFSMKWQFPEYNLFEGREGIFETDKRDYFIAGHGLFDVAGFPTSRLRHVDVYLNNNAVMDRLEQEENDKFILERFHAEQQVLNPNSPIEEAGEIYKCVGILPPNYEARDGPYGVGNFSLLPAIPPYWTPLQRYDYTYALQNHGWKGSKPFKDMIDGFWAARGDTPASPNPNLPAVRAWLEQNFDMDATLTYMAIRQWGAAYDHLTHNYFLWRRANGKWVPLPWDFDDEYYIPFINWSIYQGEVGDPNVTERGPNYLYDAIYKAFRQEFKQRLFMLNHTLLNPTNITALGYGSILSSDQGSTMRGWADQRFTIVNQKLGLGTFYRPNTPQNISPANGGPALPPAMLVTSPYNHNGSPPQPHASTTWLIRRANGTYSAPVFRRVTATNLTSMAIPFERLTFGETYFWKCIHTDADGHPSVESAETSLVFGSAPTTVPLISMDAGTLWKYEQSGALPGVNWMDPSFDDSAWPSGAPLLAQEACGCLPEPIRTPLSVGSKITIYFRKGFVFLGSTTGVTLRGRQVIDDGAVMYLNGMEVSRTRMPAGAVGNSTLGNANVGDAVYEGPFTFPAGSLVTGTNVLAVEVHQSAPGSSDLVFGLKLEALVPNTTASNILLNEILADNRGSVTNADTTPDYIELYNAASLPRDIGGMSLSDDVTRPGRFVFPTNTVIAAHGYLIVWCDDDTAAPGLHTGFGLDTHGQTVALFDATPSGWQLGDYVTFGLQIPDRSIGRALSDWRLNMPTPAAPNIEAALGSPSGLRINEWMASTTTGPDWFELFNTNTLPVALAGMFLSDTTANVTNTRIPELSYIAPRGYWQFMADEDEQQGPHHVDFRLSANGETIILSDTNETLIDQVTFGPQGLNVAQGRLLDGSANTVSFPGSASPEAANYLSVAELVVNEVLSHTMPPLQDSIEIQNVSGGPIDISGWWLSDDALDLKKFRIPTNTAVAPGGFTVFLEDQFNGTDALSPFGLNGARGDDVFLSAADSAGELTGARVSAKFEAAENGISHGRIPTSVAVDFGALATPTFNGSNAPPLVGPIVISEIQYHPPELPGDDDDYEFIELQNISGSTVPLFDPAYPTNCWRLRDAVRFTFPTNTMLAPGERTIIVGFDPVTNLTALASFRLVYGLSSNVALSGPFRGKLDNSGASVELVKPDMPVATAGADLGYVPSILVDRVKYSDAAPWPGAADGHGASLQRRTLSGYGNEPTNWFANGVTPAEVNRTNGIVSVAITAPASNATFGVGAGILITVDALDGDGTVQRVEFYADGVQIGEDSVAPFTFTWFGATPGTHFLSARAFDNGLSSASSTVLSISVTNQRPTVAIISPQNGASFVVPTNIVIDATASDPDGVVQKVEFYANTAKLGEVTNAPFRFVWTDVGAGTHTLTARAIDAYSLSVTSAPVTISAARNSYIAYVVQPGTIGGQDYGGGIGLDFNVNQPILIPRLGIFDSRTDGLSGTLTVQIFNRNPATMLASVVFNNASQGTLEAGTSSRFKPLAQPLALGPGNYSVVAWGHNSTDRNGNSGIPEPKTWTTDSGGGLLSFVGVCRNGGPGGVPVGTFPTNPDGGPADRYASGTFEFLPLVPPTIVRQPTNSHVLAGQSTSFEVAATGTAPLFYQWRRNGNVVLAQTNATFALANPQPADAGDYSVIVSNYAGSVTSTIATLTVTADSDGDGMPDVWEDTYGLNHLEYDPSLDSDGDGASNLEEYRADTNPRDAESYLRLIVGAQFPPTLEFAAASNKTYTVLWRYSVDASGWNKVTNVAAAPTNRIMTITDLTATNNTQRFYRLVTPQWP